MLRNVRQNGGRIEVAGSVKPFTAGENPRAGRNGFADLPIEIVHDLRGGQRPDIGRLVGGIAHFERLHGLHEAALEILGDRVHNDEALGRNAGLAVVNGARFHGRADRGGHIGARHDDEGITAAQFQHGFLDALASLRGNLHAGRLAAGERRRHHARVVDYTGYLLGSDEERLKRAIWKAGAAENVFNGERALRHVRCVLQQAYVARHQRRRCEPEHLPEGKVPGHDGENRADRLIADVICPALGLNGLVAQKRFGILRVIPAARCAFDRLINGGLERLAHFGRHDVAECGLLFFENVSRGQHHAGAVGELCASIAQKCGGRPCELVFDL